MTAFVSPKNDPPEVSQHDHSEDVDVVQSLPGTISERSTGFVAKQHQHHHCHH